jgi:two-component sensor histidine kinase
MRSDRIAAGIAAHIDGAVRVLLVDDDEDEHIIVGDLLRSALGDQFDLTWVSTYTAGLESLLSEKFDVGLVDYRLGERSGLELLSEAKPKELSTAIILLTGEGDISVDIDAAKAGAVGYLVKRDLTAARLERSVRYAVESGRATGRLRKLLIEQDMLIKEVHHRVKNNLQVICSLLSLQIETVGADHSAESLRQAHSRVFSMSMIHEHLHRSETLLALDFAQYIRSLAMRLFDAYCIDTDRIHLDLAVEPILLPVDDAVTCGLILNELLANSLKHAFKDGRRGLLRISFRRSSPDRVELTVADNGLGLPANFEIDAVPSLGWRVIRTLVDQLGADLWLERQEGTLVAFAWQLAATESK